MDHRVASSHPTGGMIIQRNNNRLTFASRHRVTGVQNVIEQRPFDQLLIDEGLGEIVGDVEIKANAPQQ